MINDPGPQEKTSEFETKKNPLEDGCYQRALPDEPMFILLARDSSAPLVIKEWATMRLAMVAKNILPPEDGEAAKAAIRIADEMAKWRFANYNKWKAPPT